MWVFGYGSLLWNPGFTPVETVPARLTGWRRSFCMLSIHHRGTVEEPGLVLALDRDEAAFCDGLALRVAPGDEARVHAELRERELVSSAYVEEVLPVVLADGRALEALIYVIDRDHVQYCRHDLEMQARMIARARGGRGPNTDYLFNTATHLTALGLGDAELDWLVSRVRALAG